MNIDSVVQVATLAAMKNDRETTNLIADMKAHGADVKVRRVMEDLMKSVDNCPTEGMSRVARQMRELCAAAIASAKNVARPDLAWFIFSIASSGPPGGLMDQWDEEKERFKRSQN